MPSAAKPAGIRNAHGERSFHTEGNHRFRRYSHFPAPRGNLADRAPGGPYPRPHGSALTATGNGSDDRPQCGATTHIFAGSPIRANPVPRFNPIRRGGNGIPPAVHHYRLQINNQIPVLSNAHDQFDVRALRNGQLPVTSQNIFVDGSGKNLSVRSAGSNGFVSPDRHVNTRLDPRHPV